MDTQKLHDLIDKVIGKSGPLRTPAWWMRRVLRSLIDFINDLKAEILKAMDAMRKEFVGIEREYTYAELKKLKDAGRLVPGQRYIMTDYECTVSCMPSNHEYNEFMPSLSVYDRHYNKRLYLTAMSSSQFETRALLTARSLYDSTTLCRYEVDYVFERDSTIRWCPTPLECDPLVVTFPSTGEKNLRFSRIEYDTGSANDKRYKIYLKDEDGEEFYYFITNNESRMDVVGQMKFYTPDGYYYNNARINYSKSVDRYRGIIVRMIDSESNIDVPFDYRCIKTTFFFKNIGEDIMIDDPVLKDYGRYLYNVYISPMLVKTNDIREFPLVYIGAEDVQIYCPAYKIAVYKPNVRINDIVSSQNLVIKAPYCNLYNVRNSHVTGSGLAATVPHYNAHTLIRNVTNAILDVGSSRPTIENSSNIAMNYAYLYSPFPSYISVGRNTDMVTVEVLASHVGKDSNGNIRQWNPADFVDAVEPEEQTVEQSETVEE